MLALIVFLFLSILCFYNFYYKRKNLPPGPTPVPLFGNLISLQLNPPGEQCFLDWKKRYGDVFTFWFGEIPYICVTDYKKILDIFQKDSSDTYAYRLKLLFEKYTRGGDYGVIFTDGDLWREHRRFTLHIFRDFGLGKNLMQDRILDEFMAMSKKIEGSEMNGEIGNECPSSTVEIDISKHIDIAVGSIINNLLFGYRFDDEHVSEFFELKEMLHKFFSMTMSLRGVLLLWKPDIFRHIPIFKQFFNKMQRIASALMKFYDRQISKHREEIDLSDPNCPSTDYVEAFLKEQAKAEQNGRLDHTFTMVQLRAMCFDLWAAGQETTSTTLAWGIAYILHYPEAAAKLHAELDRVVGGSDRLVTVSDKANLPYTNAVVNEIQRVANLVPMNVQRQVHEEVVIDGWKLPKGSVVIPQISAVLADESVFPEPKQFRPERFLGPDGKLQKCDALLPFSVGKRQCLGESLARMELFLFVSNLYNRYEILPVKKMPDLARDLGGTCVCRSFKCVVQKRR